MAKKNKISNKTHTDIGEGICLECVTKLNLECVNKLIEHVEELEFRLNNLLSKLAYAADEDDE